MLLKNCPLEIEILWAPTREILDFFIRLRKCTRTVVYLFNVTVGKNLSSLFCVILGSLKSVEEISCKKYPTFLGGEKEVGDDCFLSL